MPFDAKMPPEMMTPAGEGFAALHEVWLSIRRAGFGFWESAAVIACILIAQQTGAQDADGE